MQSDKWYVWRKLSYVARRIHLNGHWHTLGLHIELHDKQYSKKVELSSFHLCVSILLDFIHSLHE